jgi:two-component system, NarL family, invasion response regulator UvrY
MRVLIADGLALFRRGLRETLADAFSKVTFGEARTAQEALKHVRRQEWDVVILDISMLGKGGLDVLEDLRRLQPRLPILLFGMDAEQFARRVLKAGAAGYLNKDCLLEELKEAIKKIVGGGRYINTTLTEKLKEDPRTGADLPLHELLSGREFQVLRMIASGRTLKKIAEELSLSVKTVSTYRARILEKTGMKTNAELIRYALQTHLVD